LSLIDYAKTDRHRESLQVWEDCGRNSAKAAAILGISQSTMRDYVSITKNNAAAAGYSENWDARRHVPEGEIVIGRSIYTTTDEGEQGVAKDSTHNDRGCARQSSARFC
jgi:hypothetical protein